MPEEESEPNRKRGGSWSRAHSPVVVFGTEARSKLTVLRRPPALSLLSRESPARSPSTTGPLISEIRMSEMG